MCKLILLIVDNFYIAEIKPGEWSIQKNLMIPCLQNVKTTNHQQNNSHRTLWLKILRATVGMLFMIRKKKSLKKNS